MRHAFLERECQNDSFGVNSIAYQKRDNKVLASDGKTAEQPAPKSNVVTWRIDGRDLDAVDALIEAGIRSTRSDAAAWLIHAGIEANRPLFEKVYGTVAEIRRLRVVAQSLAQEVAGSGEGSTESTEGR
jgi:hypothetical protein